MLHVAVVFCLRRSDVLDVPCGARSNTSLHNPRIERTAFEKGATMCYSRDRVGLRLRAHSAQQRTETAVVPAQGCSRICTTGTIASQRSLHNAPIFRLLLKVAVKGTHQCDFFNFCGASGPNKQIRMQRITQVWISGVCIRVHLLGQWLWRTFHAVGGAWEGAPTADTVQQHYTDRV